MTTYKKTCVECGFVSTRTTLVHNESLLSDRSLVFLWYTLDQLWDDWKNVVKSYSDEWVYLKWRWNAFWWIWWIKKHMRKKDVVWTELYIMHKAGIAIPWEDFYNAIWHMYGGECRSIPKNKYRSKNRKKREFSPEENIQKQYISILYQWFYQFWKLLLLWYTNIPERYLEDYIIVSQYASEDDAKHVKENKYIEYNVVENILKNNQDMAVLDRCIWFSKKEVIFN